MDKISAKVEGDYIKSVRRVYGLRLLECVFRMPVTPFVKESLVLTLTAALREGRNQLTHYLHNIKICSNHLQKQMRGHFFAILESILESITKSRSETHIMRLLDALVWKYTGRDHPYLDKL